jgi:hypothetical protein
MYLLSNLITEHIMVYRNALNVLVMPSILYLNSSDKKCIIKDINFENIYYYSHT